MKNMVLILTNIKKVAHGGAENAEDVS